MMDMRKNDIFKMKNTKFSKIKKSLAACVVRKYFNIGILCIILLLNKGYRYFKDPVIDWFIFDLFKAMKMLE